MLSKGFDPLRGVWIADVLDPWPLTSRPKWPQFVRTIGFIAFLFLPIIIFSAIPSPSSGGHLIGKGSVTADIGLLGVLFFLVISVTLLPHVRRRLADLPNQLLANQIVGASILDFDPSASTYGVTLRFLERISRVDGWRGVFWFGLMLIDQIFVYWGVILGDGKPQWHKTEAVPGSLFNLLAVAETQPNLAGLWTFLVWGPTILYLMIVIARLLVIFACLCAHISSNQQLKIVPLHPDGVGGLSPIGKTSLFLSFFTFALGIDLAALTGNELVISKTIEASQNTSVITSNMTILVILWVAYFVFGTALFLLPMMSLRKRMAAAKMEYLTETAIFFCLIEEQHRADIKKSLLRPDALQGMVALDQLMRTAARMPVWPFDVATAARYFGVLVSPITPLVNIPRQSRGL